MPLQYLVIGVLELHHQFCGDALTIEYLAGCGRRVRLDVIATDLQDCLISIFVVGPDGRAHVLGGSTVCSATRHGRTA